MYEHNAIFLPTEEFGNLGRYLYYFGVYNNEFNRNSWYSITLAQLPVLKMDIYCPGDQFTSEAAVFGKWRNVRHTHRHQGGWRVQKESQVRFYYLHRTVFILIGLWTHLQPIYLSSRFWPVYSDWSVYTEHLYSVRAFKLIIITMLGSMLTQLMSLLALRFNICSIKLKQSCNLTYECVTQSSLSEPLSNPTSTVNICTTVRSGLSRKRRCVFELKSDAVISKMRSS